MLPPEQEGHRIPGRCQRRPEWRGPGAHQVAIRQVARHCVKDARTRRRFVHLAAAREPRAPPGARSAWLPMLISLASGKWSMPSSLPHAVVTSTRFWRFSIQTSWSEPTAAPCLRARRRSSAVRESSPSSAHFRAPGSVHPAGARERSRGNHRVASKWAAVFGHGLHGQTREDRRNRHLRRPCAALPARLNDARYPQMHPR
jgi:hypothetical protein